GSCLDVDGAFFDERGEEASRHVVAAERRGGRAVDVDDGDLSVEFERQPHRALRKGDGAVIERRVRPETVKSIETEPLERRFEADAVAVSSRLVGAQFEAEGLRPGGRV